MSLAKVVCSVVGIAVFQSAESFAETPSAKICASFKGNWVGEKEGGSYQGPITITFNNDCTYKWIGTTGEVNSGYLLLSNDELQYINVKGSHGRVWRSSNALEWRNVYSGDDYVVNVKKSKN